MHRSIAAGICLALALGVCGKSVAGIPLDFSLSIDAPAELLGSAGRTVEIDATVSVTSSGLAPEEPGVQGWSLSLAPVGWTIVNATTDGTAGDEVDNGGLRDTGFVALDLTDGAARAGSDCAGRAGVVNAVVLSFIMPITLPTDSPSDLLVVTLSGTIPEDGADCVACALEFVDGCQGPGQPVDNKVTLDGNTVVPRTENSSTNVCPDPDCAVPGKLNLTLSSSPVEGEGHVSDSTAISEEPLDVCVEVRVGDEGSATVYANIVSNDVDSGVQGWSISASLRGDIVAAGATDAGTAAADSPDGLRDTGFQVSQVIDPALIHPDTGGEQGEGFVSATVLSFTMPVTLPTTSTATILCMTVSTGGPMPEKETVDGSIVWVDNNTGSGQPVKNAATIRGENRRFCLLQEANISFKPSTKIPFLRCDPNIDGETNLADGIFIVNELFRGGDATTCDDSADCNDDGIKDLSVATYVLAYRFTRGPPPPAPFDACDFDSIVSITPDDEIGCDEYPFCDD